MTVIPEPQDINLTLTNKDIETIIDVLRREQHVIYEFLNYQLIVDKLKNALEGEEKDELKQNLKEPYGLSAKRSSEFAVNSSKARNKRIGNSQLPKQSMREKRGRNRAIDKLKGLPTLSC